jgi:hypothetical protein
VHLVDVMGKMVSDREAEIAQAKVAHRAHRNLPDAPSLRELFIYEHIVLDRLMPARTDAPQFQELLLCERASACSPPPRLALFVGGGSTLSTISSSNFGYSASPAPSALSLSSSATSTAVTPKAMSIFKLHEPTSVAEAAETSSVSSSSSSTALSPISPWFGACGFLALRVIHFDYVSTNTAAAPRIQNELKVWSLLTRALMTKWPSPATLTSEDILATNTQPAPSSAQGTGFWEGKSAQIGTRETGGGGSSAATAAPSRKADDGKTEKPRHSFFLPLYVSVMALTCFCQF